MTDRRRNLIVLAIVGFLLVMSLMTIVPGAPLAKKTQLGLDLRGGVELIYQAEPTPQVPKVTAQAVNDAINTIRKRTNALGVSESEVQQQGPDTIVVGLPGVKNAARAEQQVGTTAQLQFYDWEPNVIGPDGKELGEQALDYSPADNPIPSLLQAVQRGAKAKPLAEANDVPASGPNVKDLQAAGVDPNNVQAVRHYYDRKNDTAGKKFYLFSPKNKALAGPELSCKDLLQSFTDKAPVSPAPLAKPATGQCAAELNALGTSGPAVGSKIFVVPQGIIIIKAEKPSNLKNTTISDSYYVIEDDSELTGSDIKDPKQSFDPRTNEPIVTFNFSGKGRQAFARVTKRVAQRGAATILPPGVARTNANQHFAITLDDAIVSRAFIDFTENPEGIDGRTGAQINGIGTIQETQDLAQNLRIGALPIRLKLISKTQVSASLGKQALHQGLLAGAAGLILMVLFLLVFYRVLGLVAVAGLVTYGILLLALIKLIPITMTLPGIAGMILTLGVAADANIVIFERVKEEIRAGRSIPAAIANGYSKALKTIVDANVVVVGVAFILFMLATGGVKGFAFTLGIGTIVSLFTAVLATSAVLGSMARSRFLRSRHMLGVGPERHFWRRFDFMGNSKWFFSMSGVILDAGALAIAGLGVNFGIDFESGTRIKTPVEKPASVDQVRSVVSKLGYADAKIQQVKDPQLGSNVFQISTKTLQPAEVDKVHIALDKSFGVRAGDFSSSSIGPTFGAQIARTAAIALVASLLLISLYIMLRFEVKYSVPVLIALCHDVLITLGVYALTQREFNSSTVAALLTILGYSLYDTIIVFDRIRENAPRMPRATFSQIVNRSMAEVMSRSLATSFSTLLPVGALLLFGGETLRDFAFALMVGILSGTYSSIFIASPVLTEWKEREPLFRRRRALVMEDHGGSVPPYADTVLGEAGEVPVDPNAPRARTGRRQIAERPGRPATRQPAAQRMAGPLAPELAAPDAAVGAPHTIEPDEIDANGDAELAEDSASAIEGAGNGASTPATPAEQRRAARRQARQKKRHGRR
ncbi:MAG: SecD/SecF fusion protein [Thermoleophilaceae bacterium]|nr:SecD/SecF fusion protein [Thermoleophilaceae bacterium]